MNWLITALSVASVGHVMPVAALANEECAAWLEYKLPGLGTKEAARAQAYADCIATPWLPVAAGFEAKLTSCLKQKPAKTSARLRDAVTWIEHVARNNPGCETRLTIKSDNNAQN